MNYNKCFQKHALHGNKPSKALHCHKRWHDPFATCAVTVLVCMLLLLKRTFSGVKEAVAVFNCIPDICSL